MRKLILQVQTTIDGFMADGNDRTNWQLWKWDTQWNWDNDLKSRFMTTINSVDCILLSRKMAKEGFLSHWAQAAQDPKDPRYAYASGINKKQKVVFSKTMTHSEWPGIDLAKGDLVDVVTLLKNQPGQDIIVYGGVNFVTSLINANLIDEFQLYINPAVLGSGMKVFPKQMKLTPIDAKLYPCGIIVQTFNPSR